MCYISQSSPVRSWLTFRSTSPSYDFRRARGLIEATNQAPQVARVYLVRFDRPYHYNGSLRPASHLLKKASIRCSASFFSQDQLDIHSVPVCR